VAAFLTHPVVRTDCSERGRLVVIALQFVKSILRTAVQFSSSAVNED